MRLLPPATLVLGLLGGVALGGAASAGCIRPSATVRAQALLRRGHDEEAAATLQQRLAGHPDDVAARRLLIRVLGSTGDIVAARGQVEELARWLPPHDPSPYLELGHALELTHSYDEALEAYDTAAAIAPASPDGPREGGMRSARWGELEEASPRLEEALKRGARDAETWHVLGLVRLHLNDYDRRRRKPIALEPRQTRRTPSAGSGSRRSASCGEIPSSRSTRTTRCSRVRRDSRPRSSAGPGPSRSSVDATKPATRSTSLRRWAPPRVPWRGSAPPSRTPPGLHSNLRHYRAE